jgi:23S rRNA (cytosine1962-C5)-methyltransferase
VSANRDRIERALAARAPLVDPKHEGALRLFNGFTEGNPSLVVDLYGKTVVLFDHAAAGAGEADVTEALEVVRGAFPWVAAAVRKPRDAPTADERRGAILLGTEKDLTRAIRENGVRYAISLLMHRDATFYLDTRELRAWAKRTLAGKQVLNCFAYTGSLGVAARAAEAAEVVHVDKNRAFLNVAKDSYVLNGWPISRPSFVAADFFDFVTRAKRAERLFDCVFLDPPFFSTTTFGRVDLAQQVHRTINKVRPLVGDGGWLVAVDNALFLSGADYEKSLEALCADGYLSLEERIAVPPDVVGLAREGAPAWPADPSPFNHPTKIAVLRVRRKDGKRASGA